ncbi:MAG: hypothetical protein P8X96_10175 [Desulfobacteraceae bacterium]
MNKITARTFLLIFCSLLVASVVAAQRGWAQGKNLPLAHPQEEGDLRKCSECHETESNEFPFKRFEHTPFFGDTHRLTAVGSQRVCQICHRTSFCADCHGTGAGLRPSVKRHGDTRRLMPHRGDYLTRHRIDGRLNPGKCFRCHGRPKAAASCKPCHG